MQLNNDRILILRQAIVKLAQMLTNSGIEVTQRGISAYVRSDPKTGKPVQVNLPFLPDNAPPELVDAIQGFLDHEVAHVLFSDFNALKRIKDRREHAFTNVLEDARIEKAMAAKFAGAGVNLTTTGDFFIKTLLTPALAELSEKPDATEAEFTAVLMMPAMRAAAGQIAFKQFMDEDDKWSKIPKLAEACKALGSAIEGVSSTDECVTVARKVIAKVAGPAPTPPAPPAPPAPPVPPEEEEEEELPPTAPTPPAPAEPPEEDEATPPAAPEDDEDEPAPPAAPEYDEDDENESAPPAEPESEPAGAEATMVPGDDDGVPEDPSEREGEILDSATGGEGAGTDKESTTSDALSHIDENGANDYDEELSRAISKTAAETSEGAEYLIYTNEFDRIETMKVGTGYDPAMLKRMEDKVAGMAGPMQKDLERAIVARSRVVWEGGRRSGRLHTANLSRLAVGDVRVFRKRQENNSKDAAVCLVIDASGSMSGSKIHTAAASAFALSQVLDRLGISHEVICFTTGAVPKEVAEGMAKEKASNPGINYSRSEPLFMPILKNYHERLSTDVKSRFAWLPNARFYANNIDGESVLIAAQRLAARKEAGKCLIVLSDGAPSCCGDSRAVSKHLRDTVKRIEKSGINTIGIGIESSEVTRYYAKNIVINRVEELPTRVIGELRKLLLS